MHHQYREYPVPMAETLEILVKDGQLRRNLPDAPDLRNAHIIGLFLRPQNQSVNRYSKNGHLLISNEMLAKAFLTLKVDGHIHFDDVPLEFFERETISGEYIQLDIPKGFDPQNSFIRFSESTNVNAGAVELVFIKTPC